MDADDKLAAAVRPSTSQAIASKLLSHDVKDLQKVSKYAAKKENHLKKLSEDFNEMGKLRLIWDAKVPKKNKRFYYFFTLCPSNREEVLAEIKKYQDFYEEMSSVVRHINKNAKDKETNESSNDDDKDVNEKEDEEADPGNTTGDVKKRIQMFEKGFHKVAEDNSDIGKGSSEEKTDNENINPYLIILELNEKLTEMTQAAKLGEQNTGSSTVYNLHKEFIAKHKKLESMIKKVECVALKDGLRQATDGWQESIRAIGDLRSDLKHNEAKFDSMCERFDRLATQHELLLNQQQLLQGTLREICTKVEQQKNSKGGP